MTPGKPQVLVPSLPKRFRFSHDEYTDLMCDPAFAAYALLGIRLDVFQSVRLKTYWWWQEVIDSSGFSTGKTIVDWAFAVLRAILLPEQDVGVYYPIFETGKNSFWRYMNTCRSRIFAAHLGRVDQQGEDSGSGKIEGGGAYKAFFRNGSSIIMPAPSFMKKAATQSSLRLNTLIVEEWTHIDSLWGGGDEGGIDAQLKGRTTKPSYSKHHPIWGNHILLTAPAKTQLHPGYPRYKRMEQEVARGNPNCMVITFSYKDYSNLPCHTGKSFRDEYRIDSVIDSMRRSKGRAEQHGEVFGIWARSGAGWFTQEMLLRCVEQGRQRQLTPLVQAETT